MLRNTFMMISAARPRRLIRKPFLGFGSTSTQPTSRSICFQCKDRAAPVVKATSIVHLSKPTARSATSSCGAKPADIQCSSSPLDVSSHYSIFPKTLSLGPPPAGPFSIDLISLRREFLQLQGLFHPDKFPPEQRAKAEFLSSRINEAYKALRDPLTRTQYLLLHIYGIDVMSEDNSSHPADPGILIEVMEAQESIEEAEREEQITVLKEQNQERIKQTVRRLEEAFSSGNTEAARTECIRLRYWVSLGEGLNAWNGKGSDVRLVH